jgi:hypothetical protein
MTQAEVIGELVDICVRQAELIQSQGYLLAQFSAWDQEEEAMTQRTRLEGIVGSLEESRPYDHTWDMYYDEFEDLE